MLDESPEALMKSRMRSFDRRRLLRPYRSGEAIDLALRIYRSIARPVLVFSLPTMTLAAAGLLFISTFVYPSLTETKFEGNVGAQFGEVSFGLLVAFVVVCPLMVVSLGYVSGLCVRLTSNIILGQELDLDLARREAPKSAMLMFRTIFASMIRALVVLVVAVLLLGVSALLSSMGPEAAIIQGMIAFIAIVGIFVGVLSLPYVLFQMCLAPAAAILENLTPKEAFVRSKFLLKKPVAIPGAGDVIAHLWVIIILGTLLLCGGLAAAVSMFPIEGWLQGQIWLGPWVEILIGLVHILPFALAIWLLAPLWSTTVTVLYYDRRSRLEAYDISILADDVLKSKRARAPLA
jgi:hypothetical protein